jgi:hypothetical protein
MEPVLRERFEGSEAMFFNVATHPLGHPSPKAAEPHRSEIG